MNDEAKQFFDAVMDIPAKNYRQHELLTLAAKIPPTALTKFTEYHVVSNAFQVFSRSDFENYLQDLGIEWRDLRYFEGRHYQFVCFDAKRIDEYSMLIRTHPFEGCKVKISPSMNPVTPKTRSTQVTRDPR